MPTTSGSCRYPWKSKRKSDGVRGATPNDGLKRPGIVPVSGAVGARPRNGSEAASAAFAFFLRRAGFAAGTAALISTVGGSVAFTSVAAGSGFVGSGFASAAGLAAPGVVSGVGVAGVAGGVAGTV